MTRSWGGLLVAVGGVVVGLTACASSNLSVSEPLELGQAPLCEASATVRAPWGSNEVLVADNEVRSRLFLLRRQTDGSLGGQRELLLSGIGPEDIEALAAVGDIVVVVGSHGRSGRCVPRPESRWIDLVRRAEGGSLEGVRRIDVTGVWTAATSSVGACLEQLFIAPAPDAAQAVCAALVTAEQSARLGDCLPLDIEAAAAATDTAGRQRLWLGLRRPRVDGLPVLLRVAPSLDALRFDAVALIDGVGDRGVRAMTVRDGRLWMVLGPAPADYGHSSLWRAPASRLAQGGTVRGRIVSDQLPPDSEGLIVDDDRIFVLLDGDEGERRDVPCQTPSRYVIVR